LANGRIQERNAIVGLIFAVGQGGRPATQFLWHSIADTVCHPSAANSPMAGCGTDSSLWTWAVRVHFAVVEGWRAFAP
jgi:hypothetical protein